MKESHKAKMANRKLARQNAMPSSGTWMYKTNRAGNPANVVHERAHLVDAQLEARQGRPLQLDRHEDRQLVGYCYLEYVK